MKKTIYVNDEVEVIACDICGFEPYWDSEDEVPSMARCGICKRDCCYKHIEYKPLFGLQETICKECFTKSKEFEEAFQKELSPINQASEEANKLYYKLNQDKVNLRNKYMDKIKNGS